MRLPDDAEVSSEVWDEVIKCMKIRVQDKVPVIRTLAVRALARFVNDAENSDILDLLLEVLPVEQNAVSVVFSFVQWNRILLVVECLILWHICRRFVRQLY